MLEGRRLPLDRPGVDGSHRAGRHRGAGWPPWASMVTLIGDGITFHDALAAAAGTIGYEILTSSRARHRLAVALEGGWNRILDGAAAVGRAATSASFAGRWGRWRRSPPLGLSGRWYDLPWHWRNFARKPAPRHGVFLRPRWGRPPGSHRRGAGAASPTTRASPSFHRRSGRWRMRWCCPSPANPAPVIAALDDLRRAAIGAAFAAETGTTRVTDQIDALATLSTDPDALSCHAASGGHPPRRRRCWCWWRTSWRWQAAS